MRSDGRPGGDARHRGGGRDHAAAEVGGSARELGTAPGGWPLRAWGGALGRRSGPSQPVSPVQLYLGLGSGGDQRRDGLGLHLGGGEYGASVAAPPSQAFAPLG